MKHRHLRYAVAVVVLALAVIGPFVVQQWRLQSAVGLYAMTIRAADGTVLGTGRLDIRSLRSRLGRDASFPYLYMYADGDDIIASGAMDLTPSGLQAINTTGRALSGSLHRTVVPAQCEADGYFELTILPRSLHDDVWCCLRRTADGYAGTVYHDGHLGRLPLGNIILRK